MPGREVGKYEGGDRVKRGDKTRGRWAGRRVHTKVGIEEVRDKSRNATNKRGGQGINK